MVKEVTKVYKINNENKEQLSYENISHLKIISFKYNCEFIRLGFPHIYKKSKNY